MSSEVIFIFVCVNICQRLEVMETTAKSLWIAIFLSVSSLATEITESVVEVTTEPFDVPLVITTTPPSPSEWPLTQAPNDNGMAISVIPEEIKEDSPPSGKEEEEAATEVDSQPLLVTFPDNHKNFTSSQYLEDDTFPPYHSHINSYQQQYKNFYEQKQLFNTKPIKFEENSKTNYYLPQNVDYGLESEPTAPQDKQPQQQFYLNYEDDYKKNSYLPHKVNYVWNYNNEQQKNEPKFHSKFEENSKKNKYLLQGGKNFLYPSVQNDKNSQQLPSNRKPFAYPFESERIPQSWYKSTGGGFSAAQESPKEYVVRGHDDHPVPYYPFPYRSPYEHQIQQSHSFHEEHHEVAKDEKAGKAWKKMFSVLTALVPLGLFLATFTPNVIAVNSTLNGKSTRQRSVENISPLKLREKEVMRVLKEYGGEALREDQCEDRVICELARKGDQPLANSIEKGFLYLANETPWDVAEKAGMNDLFKAIRTGDCEAFKCHSKRIKKDIIKNKMEKKSAKNI